jgi:hypothetical protein
MRKTRELRVQQSIITATAALLTWHGTVWADGRFEQVIVRLEQTVEDGDCEIAFEATSGTTGLTALKVMAPDGRTVIDFKSPDTKLGMRQIVLESPEPRNDGRLQADFPPGVYRFSGTLTSGATLQGEATLSHKFPSIARIVHPRPGERDVPATGLQIRWNPVPDAVAYVVVIEQEKTGHEIKVDLGVTANSFTVGDKFLVPGLEYKLAIGTVGKEGNRTISEIDFVTAERK